MSPLYHHSLYTNMSSDSNSSLNTVPIPRPHISFNPDIPPNPRSSPPSGNINVSRELYRELMADLFAPEAPAIAPPSPPRPFNPPDHSTSLNPPSAPLPAVMREINRELTAELAALEAEARAFPPCPPNLPSPWGPLHQARPFGSQCPHFWVRSSSSLTSPQRRVVINEWRCERCDDRMTRRYVQRGDEEPRDAGSGMVDGEWSARVCDPRGFGC
jgi:hypothetical protein